MKRFFLLVTLLFVVGCYYKKSPSMRLCTRLDWQSIVDMFPQNVDQIEQIAKKSIAVMNNMLEALKKDSHHAYTFHNTVRLYDNAKFTFIMNMQLLSSIVMLSSDQAMVAAANSALIELQKYQAEKLIRNQTILDTFQDYAQYGHDDQSKTMLTRSFLQKTIERLEHEGANLSDDVRSYLNTLSQEISELQAQFSTNILCQNLFITCKKHELENVPQSFLQSLDRQGDMYIVPLTYESFFTILENCSNAATRKKLYLAFSNRAYPINLTILELLLSKRNEYARLVGYKNFAEYESAFQMIGSADQIKDFLYDMIADTNKVVQKDFAQLIADLPESVKLSHHGKLYPWDEAFVKNRYRKKHYSIDTHAVAEYFPLSHVLAELQKQFGQFFALGFDQVSNQGLWDKNLICLRVRLLHTSEIIGYLIFDLYARPGKSQQASQMNIIPAMQDDCNFSCSGLSIIATNFNAPTSDQEPLLSFHDVKILLHEFGHALHELFGATSFVDFSGMNGPRDFIEVPSQLLEMWMDDPLMVKLFSKHYKTKEHLSDTMIEKIIAAEKFGRASLLQRQCLLSLIALEFGSHDASKKLHDIVGSLYKSVRCDVEYSSEDYFETSFEHLVGYGSHYYGYVWSQVLAAGLFEYIIKHGIRNRHVGQKLYDSLLSYGGSKDPHVLINLLLGTSITKQALLDSLKQSN